MVSSLLNLSSAITFSTPVHVNSEELNILDAIPPFSPTPKTSAIPSYIESIFTISGVSKGVSSIQKSVAGFNSIDPTYSVIKNGFIFSTLVASGWLINSTSSKFKVNTDPFRVILGEAKSSTTE